LDPVLLEIPERLEGERVVLRPYGPEDAQALWEAVAESREALEPWLPWVRGYRGPEDARAYCARARARWLLREDLPVAIFDRQDGGFLGGTGLHRIDWSVPCFEIGYWLRRSVWGQGYAQEAVRLLVRLAFGVLAAQRVEVRVDPRNARSLRVPEALGFVREGVLRRVAPGGPEGQAADRVVFALTADDWPRVPWAAPGPPDNSEG
jgi:RimJ/RimL family protein N-acetyltransferase